MLNFDGTTHMKLNHTCANCFEDIQYFSFFKAMINDENILVFINYFFDRKVIL
jgi:hypothetical protein